MPEEIQRTRLRLTCPPCGEVFTADNEDTLVAMAVEHAEVSRYESARAVVNDVFCGSASALADLDRIDKAVWRR